MTTLDYLFRRVIPAASDLLPEKMRSPHATAMLLAIALQESGAAHRRQVGGPARGFWQFERAGVAGVRQHAATHDHLTAAMVTLRYAPTSTTENLQQALADNDVLACVFARLLLWTLPDALPSSDNPGEGWRQYLAAWRPGKPHPSVWPDLYRTAWSIVNAPLGRPS
jgi:hypothetical protein